jgi:outer membrane protein
MKRFLIILSTVLAVGVAATSRAQTPPALKVGVFDANRVSEETDEGKRIAAKLSAFGDKKKAELAAKEKEVGEMRAQLESQNLSLSPEKLQQLQKDVQKKGLELQQAQEAARNEFQIEVSDAQNKFQEQLIRVITQFGRDEGFTLVIERSTGGVAFAAESIDVTTAIVDKFNELVKNTAEAPPAGAAKPPAAGTPKPTPVPLAPPKKP